MRLARVSETFYLDQPASGSLQSLVRGEVVALPLKGIIDVAAEKARLEKEITKVEADIKRVDAKLNNPEFVRKAPEEIIEGEKEKREEAESRRAKLLEALLGRFAVLGNHDYTYGADEVAAALEAYGITVLSDERRTLRHEGHDIDLIGLPDARNLRAAGRTLLAGLPSGRPTIVLAHDPFWFAHVPAGPPLSLAGPTHGGGRRLLRL